MKKRSIFLLLTLAGLAAIPGFRASAADAAAAEGSTGAFEATLFAPGVVSTPDDEFGSALSPDGKTVFFARRSPTTSTTPVQAIFFSRLESGRWTTPEIAPFSGVWPDFSPALSPDGSKLFFGSLRPREGSAIRADADIWVVEKSGSGWGAPRNLGAPVNTDHNESSPSVAADGTLYFGSDRKEEPEASTSGGPRCGMESTVRPSTSTPPSIPPPTNPSPRFHPIRASSCSPRSAGRKTRRPGARSTRARISTPAGASTAPGSRRATSAPR